MTAPALSAPAEPLDLLLLQARLLHKLLATSLRAF